MIEHEKYMLLALESAKNAYDTEEVPVGGLIVYQDKIIAQNYNKKRIEKDSTAHAEMLLIKEASQVLNNWRLTDCTMYITLEPCPMCAGAIIQSRLSKLVFGAKNPIYGSFGSVISLQNYFPDAKKLEIVSGILETETAYLMKSFFRNKKK